MKTKTFYLYWRDGTRNEVKGSDIADAFTRAGFGGGAVRALDFYSEKKYEWDKEKKDWSREAV